MLKFDSDGYQRQVSPYDPETLLEVSPDWRGYALDMFLEHFLYISALETYREQETWNRPHDLVRGIIRL